MNDEFESLNEEEKLTAENDFMKMKIMAEHGAQFYSPSGEKEIPAEIENIFLSNIIELERQFAARKTTTVFEKVGKPAHFRPESEIPDEEIQQAWKDLSNYLNENGVELSVCSPSVTARNLYRFAIDELFQCEIDDVNVPGMIRGFIYDEFYPDHEYDNTRTATQNCIENIFSKKPFEWMQDFADRLRLNDHAPLTQQDFKHMINRFQDAYDEIKLIDCSVDSASIKDKCCIVQGRYCVETKLENEVTGYEGKWLVEFKLDDQLGYWYIENVQMQGIFFEGNSTQYHCSMRYTGYRKKSGSE